MIDESQKNKRLSDERKGALAGWDTSASDDARLRQSYPEPDEHTEQAKRIVEAMRRENPGFWFWHDPGVYTEFVEGVAASLRGDKKPSRLVLPEEEEAPMMTREAHDKFFANTEAMQKVLPKKL